MSGGKSKEFTIGYNYFFGLHQVACMAPVDGISSLHFDDREAWRGSVGASSIEVNAPSLFGGKEREGGVAGYIDVLSGSETQGVNGYLKQVLNQGTWTLANSVGVYADDAYNPGNVPAFRGVASLVFLRFMWGNNPYPKRMRQRWHNIFSTYEETNNPGDWEPNLAPICRSYGIGDQAIYLVLDTSGTMGEGNKYENMRTAAKNFVTTLSEADGVVSLRIKPFGTQGGVGPYFERIPFVASDLADAISFLDNNMDGPVGPTIYDEHVSGAPGYYELVDSTLLGTERYSDFEPAVSGATSRIEDQNVVSSISRILLFLSDGEANEGTDVAAKAILDTIAGVKVYGIGIETNDDLFTIDNTASDGVPIVSDDSDEIAIFLERPFLSFSDLNAAHILRDVLINPTSGGSGDTTEIGTSFSIAAQTLFDEGMGFSFHWQNPSDRDSFKRLVEQHANCVTYFDQSTGNWEIKLIRPDYDVGTLFTFDRSKIVEWIDYEKPQQAELPNHITLVYTRRENGEEASMSAFNTAAIQVVGRVIPEKVEMVGVTCPALAPKILQREMVARTQPFAKGGIRVAYCPTDINLGSAFIINEPRMGIENLVMRVTEIEETDGQDNSIILRFAEDVFQYNPIDDGTVSEDTATTGQQATTAQPSTTIFYEEASYFDQVFVRGQTEIDSALVADPDVGNWQITGDQFNSAHINAIVVRDDTSSWVQVAQSNLMPVWTLDGELSRAANIVTFTADVNGREAEQETGQIIQIDAERMRLDSIAVNSATGKATFTVGRGVLDTVPALHAAGSVVMGWQSFVGTDTIDYTAGETIDVRFLPKTASDTLDINDATTQSLTMDSRAIRPYPVGKLQAAGSYAPSTEQSGIIEITWAHRSRLTQTSIAVLDHTDDSIAVESGVEYDIVRRLVNVSGGMETVIDVDETSIDSPESTTSINTDLSEMDASADATTAYAEIGIKSKRAGYENWQTPFVRLPYAPFGPDGDPFADDVAILYRFNEAAGTDDLPENDGYADADLAHRDSPTTVGNDATPTKHYASSAHFDTLRGLITTAAPPSTEYGIADSFGSLTIEAWFYLDNLDNVNYLFSTNRSTNKGGIEANMGMGGDLNVQIRDVDENLVMDFDAASGFVLSGSWVHVALVRTGTRDWEFFVNGSSVGNATQTDEGDDLNELVIGGRQGYVPPTNFHYDSFRWTTGVARYNIAFTPEEFTPPNISLSHLSDSDTFYPLSLVVVGAQTITLAHYDDTDIFPSQSISLASGNQDISLAHVDDSDFFYGFIIAANDLEITLAHLAGTSTFYGMSIYSIPFANGDVFDGRSAADTNPDVLNAEGSGDVQPNVLDGGVAGPGWANSDVLDARTAADTNPDIADGGNATTSNNEIVTDGGDAT